MMHIETERKFLVRGFGFRAEATQVHRLRQGYICREAGRTVRVRTSDERAWLTIKGPSMGEISRPEWEKEIELAEAEELMKLCRNDIIEKYRHIVPFGGKIFEVDEFLGKNTGLIVAEIELESPDEAFERPEWLGEEVTGDGRYYNSSLTTAPFSTWKD